MPFQYKRVDPQHFNSRQWRNAKWNTQIHFVLVSFVARGFGVTIPDLVSHIVTHEDKRRGRQDKAEGNGRETEIARNSSKNIWGLA